MSVQIGRGGVGQQGPGEIKNERVAHQAVELAVKLSDEKKQAARQSIRTASKAIIQYRRADASLKAKETLLQEKGGQLGPEERAKLESHLQTEREMVNQLKDRADQANTEASKSRGEAREAEDKRIEVEQTANRVLRSLGKGEPYKAKRPDEDLFIAELVTEKLMRMIGTVKKANPRQLATFDARKMTAALKGSLSAGAALLEQQLEINHDLLYRQGLLEDISDNLGEMGRGLSGEESLNEEMANDAFAGLARCAEKFGPDGARKMAQAFVKGALDGKEKLADASILGHRIGEALASSDSGATFALEIALAFGGAGDAESAEVTLGALADALRAMRERFDQASRRGDALDAELAKALTAPSAWADPDALLDTFVGFEDTNMIEYLSYEATAKALAAMLPGAARALFIARQGGLPQIPTTAVLLQEAKLAIGRTDRLALTEGGHQRITEALDVQKKGQPTFLNELPEVSRTLPKVQNGLRLVGAQDTFEDGTNNLTLDVGQCLARMLAPRLLALKKNGKLAEMLDLLASTLGHNPDLFGLAPVDAKPVYELLKALTYSRKVEEMEKALRGFSKHRSSAMNSTVLVVAACCGATIPTGDGSELRALLSETAARLNPDRKGLAVILSLVKRLAPTASAAGIVALVGTIILYKAGDVTDRVAAAFNGVASGLTGDARFDASPEFLTQVGAMLASTSGARMGEVIAQAVLATRGQAPASERALTPSLRARPEKKQAQAASEDLDFLRSFANTQAA